MSDSITNNHDTNPIAALQQHDSAAEGHKVSTESADRRDPLSEAERVWKEEDWDGALGILREKVLPSLGTPEARARLHTLMDKIAVWLEIKDLNSEAGKSKENNREAEALTSYCRVLEIAQDSKSGLPSEVRKRLHDLLQLQTHGFHNDAVHQQALQLQSSLVYDLFDDRPARRYLVPSLDEWIALSRKKAARGAISSQIALGQHEHAYALAKQSISEDPGDIFLIELTVKARRGLASQLVFSISKRLSRAHELAERGEAQKAIQLLDETFEDFVSPISARHPEVLRSDELEFLLSQTEHSRYDLRLLLPIIEEVDRLANLVQECVSEGNYSEAIDLVAQAQKVDPDRKARRTWDQLDYLFDIALGRTVQWLQREAEYNLRPDELEHQARRIGQISYSVGRSAQNQELLHEIENMVRSAQGRIQTNTEVRQLMAARRFSEARSALEEALSRWPNDRDLRRVQIDLAEQQATRVIDQCQHALCAPAPSRDHLTMLQAAVQEVLTDYRQVLDSSTLLQLQIHARALETEYIRLRIKEGYRALQSLILEAASAICLEVTERSGSLGDVALLSEARRFYDEVELVIKRQEAAVRQAQLLKFFATAGFEVQEAWEGGAMLLPREASLRNRLGPSVAVHIRLDIQADRKLLTELVEETTTRYEQQVADRVTFVVVEQQPDFAALSFMQSYRFAERLAIVPFGASQVREALQRGTCGIVLNDVINTYLGRADLYAAPNPVSDVLSFFGRERVIDLVNSALEKDSHIGLFGIRKIGKTSLVKYLASQAPYPVAWLSLQESFTPDQVFYLAIREWKQALRLRFPRSVLSDFQTEHLDSSDSSTEAFAADVQTLLKTLTELGATPRLILCLDEVDRITPGSAAAEEQVQGFSDLMGFLQGLATRVKSLNLIVCGEHPTISRTHFFEGSGFSIQNPLFQGLHEIFLGPFSEEETNEMVVKIGALMGIEFDPLSLKAIYDWSGGHPFLARQVCSRAIGQVNIRPVRIMASQIREASERFLRESPYPKQEMWRQLRTAGQAVILHHLVEHGSSSENELIPQTLSPKDRWSLQQALAYLEERHLIKREQTAVSIPYGCFREWIGREGRGA